MSDDVKNAAPDVVVIKGDQLVEIRKYAVEKAIAASDGRHPPAMVMVSAKAIEQFILTGQTASKDQP